MLLAGFIINSATLDKSVETYFDETNLADIWVYTRNVSDDDLAFFDSLKTQKNIKFEQRLYFEVPAKISSSNALSSAKIYVSKGSISTPYVESESYVDLGKKGCLIDKKVAENNNVKLRETTVSFEFDFEAFGMAQTLQFDVPINGTMCLDECTDTYSSWPIFFSEEEFLRLLNIELAKKSLPEISVLPYNQVLIKTDSVENIKKEINDYYNSKSDDSLLLISDRTQVESVVLLNGEVSQSKKMIYVFPVIFLIVSILVILTTTNQLIIQEQIKIGTLKSIGVSDKKILRHYSMYGTILVLIGSIFGIVLGGLIIPNIMFVKYNLVYSIPYDYIKTKIPWIIILLVFFFMVLLGFLVSYLSCRSILHKKPIECLRRDIKLNDKILMQKSKQSKKLPLSLKMALRNVRLKPTRTIMATLGIAGCVALLLCGFGVGDTLSYSKNNDLNKLFVYDISSTYTNSDFLSELETLDENIEEIELYQQFYVQARSDKSVKSIKLFQIQQNSSLCNINLKVGEAVISKHLAKELLISKGDTITVTAGNVQKKITITDTIQTSVYNGIFTCDAIGFDSKLASRGVWIKTKANIDEITEKINKINGTNTATTKTETLENVDNKISSIGVMTSTLKFFAIMLAVVVLLNLIFLILKERHREIATLKVLGEGSFQIGLCVLYEILIMTVVGLVLGMFLGYPLLVLVLSINKVEVFNFLFHINFVSYLLTILLVAITTAVIFLLCESKIKNINMIESLKSIE